MRRKDFFSGNSSDLVIEQDLMRLFKVSGGMTRERGTDSTMACFVNILPQCIPLCDFLEKRCGCVTFIIRTTQGFEAVLFGLRHKRPKHILIFGRKVIFYVHKTTQILCATATATGVIADSSVNCEQTFENRRGCC